MPRKSTSASPSKSSKRKEAPQEDLEDAKRIKVDVEGKNLGNVVGGYKATLHNPNASEEAKDHAEAMIDVLDPDHTVGQKNPDEPDLNGKNIGNVVGGYKATISNPNSTEEAKEHAEMMIEKIDPDHLVGQKKSESDEVDPLKHVGNVVGGYKATLHNPNVSDEAKEHAQKMIDKLDPDHTVGKKKSDDEVSLEGKNIGNVIGGYKAAMHNPNISDEAREHAEKMVDQLDPDHTTDNKRDVDDLTGKDLGHVIAGYKGVLSRANVSEEAREHAQKMLDELAPHYNEGRKTHDVVSHYKSRASSDSHAPHEREHAQKMYDELEHHTKPRNERLNRHGKDINHVIAGYKGTLSNARDSEGAKTHARKMLEHLEPHHKEGRHLGHVIGGYKAALSNPNTSEEAKDHARDMLEELGAYDDEFYGSSDSSSKGRYAKDDSEKNPGNVIGGIKAAIKNPNVSEEAKEDLKSRLNDAKVAF